MLFFKNNKTSSFLLSGLIYLQEMEVLRKQVEYLAEENGKLVGHQNLHQKIQYVVRLKKENVRLAEVNSENYSDTLTLCF